MMCADVLPTTFFGSLSTECGVETVLLALVREMGSDAFVLLNASSVRRGVLIPDHKPIWQHTV